MNVTTDAPNRNNKITTICYRLPAISISFQEKNRDDLKLTNESPMF